MTAMRMVVSKFLQNQVSFPSALSAPSGSKLENREQNTGYYGEIKERYNVTEAAPLR